jgi:hypothetical protein
MHLGVSPWISPLVGPAADLSVVGLLVAIRYLPLRGVDGRGLRPARCLLVFTGVATLTLNVAQPISQDAYGRAAFDAVGPLLLIGWAEVGPGLLRQIHAVRTVPPAPESDDSALAGPAESGRSVRSSSAATARRERPTRGGGRSDSRSGRGRTSSQRQVPQRAQDLVMEARRMDAEHRREFGRPI